MKTRPKDIWRFLADTRNYSPNFNPPIRYVLPRKWDITSRIDSLFCPTKILNRYHLFVNERIVELPFVHRVLRSGSGNRILEFGCSNSKLAIELASSGYFVTGVDFRPYALTHPNLKFHQRNFFNLDLEESSFDAIIAISAIEHVGLGAYGETIQEAETDKKLIEIFYRLLRPSGQLIVTVPFGSKKVTARYRIYDHRSLNALLDDFTIQHEEYYQRKDYSVWLPTSGCELSQLDWEPIKTGSGAEGVACIAALRPSDL